MAPISSDPAMASDDSLAPQRPPFVTLNSGSGGDMLHSASPSTPPPARDLLHTRPSTASSGRSVGPTPFYSAPEMAPSVEMLLPPPSRLRAPGRPYQDYSAPSSALSSRRTSWDSEMGSRFDRADTYATPFADSRVPCRAGSDEENINTQTVSEKYNIMPSAGLLLFPEDVEKDDYLHNPEPGDNDREKCDIWNKRGLVNLGGLAFVTLGTLALFVAYPALTFVKEVEAPKYSACAANVLCLSDNFPLLKNIRSGLIDPDTPSSAMTKTAADGTQMNLVFSDEFNVDGRTFYDGDDPYFQGVDIWYGGTQDLEWYDPDAITTANGTLNIRFDAFQNHNLNYRSGMLQSWNQMCFKGGRLEASISLPGRGDIEGFWPGFWTMGNLGRPGYSATSDGMWPYSYEDTCDVGITPNQSSPDGISRLPGMRLPACTCSGQDHPSPGISRSAPEIDVLEASVGFMGPGPFDGATGTASQSFQAAPFDIWYQPDANFMAIDDYSISGLNSYRGGPYQEALSVVTWLNNEWYEGNAYQTFAIEYTPGAEGTITWFVGEDATWHLDNRALRSNGNIGQRVVPQEPMAVVMNFGMSNSFATLFLANLAELFPATMRFDYVRIYQDASSDPVVTCDPEGYPTTEYIATHPEPYANPNLTIWSETEYPKPLNSLMDGCSV